MRLSSSFSLIGLAMFSTFLSIGCDSRPSGRLVVYPVSGRITVDGAPAEGAILTFFGQEEGLKGRRVPVPMATADENGHFEVRSYGANDGAPAGKFKVTVAWPEPRPEGADEEFYEAPDRLGGKYAHPRETPFEVTIEEGGTQLAPIEITR